MHHVYIQLRMFLEDLDPGPLLLLFASSGSLDGQVNIGKLTHHLQLPAKCILQTIKDPQVCPKIISFRKDSLTTTPKNIQKVEP